MKAGKTDLEVGTRIRITKIYDTEDQELVGMEGEVTHPFPGLMSGNTKYVAGIVVDPKFSDKPADGSSTLNLKFNLTKGDEFFPVELIEAEVHSDDRRAEVSFNAVDYFTQATLEEIQALEKCGWGGDYPADAVAEFFETKHRNVGNLFSYLAVANKVRWNDAIGFECHVDEESAKAWLMANRQEIGLQVIDVIDEDVAVFVADGYRIDFNSESPEKRQEWRERYKCLQYEVDWEGFVSPAKLASLKP